MANTRLGLNNLLAQATLKNGSGGSAPAIEELSPYSMSNAQNDDRYSLWRTTSAPPATLFVDYDLGSSVELNAVAILGLRTFGNGTIDFCDVYTAPAAGGYFPPVWTWRASIDVDGSEDPRDMGATFSSVTPRYVRFGFSSAGSIEWSIGRLWAGLVYDTGGIHSPGGSVTVIKNRIETPLPGGAVVLNTLGDNGAEWTMPWASVPSATRSLWLDAYNSSGSIVLVDHNNKFYEVIFSGGQYSEAIGFSGLYDMNISLKRLP